MRKLLKWKWLNITVLTLFFLNTSGLDAYAWSLPSFNFKGTATVKGRVTSLATGKPIPQANVSLLNLNRKKLTSTTADKNGRYTIKRRVRICGYYIVEASASDYYSSDIPYLLRANKTSQLNFRLKPKIPEINFPPTITINPVSTPTNQDVTLSYEVSDDFSSPEDIVVGGDESPYTEDGSYHVTLVATDEAGNSSQATVDFTIDKTLPKIIISSPQDGVILTTSKVTLEGKVDGVAFKETRDLTEGPNILTKEVTDEAGNASSTSVSVYVYLGRTIGTEGGEVTSFDGKVKLIIPSEALSEPTQIGILPLSEEFLEDLAPQDRRLLCIAEFRPHGLQFNKPAKIIYSLDEAEIPGTPVELGFYDSSKEEVIILGEGRGILSDGQDSRGPEVSGGSVRLGFDSSRRYTTDRGEDEDIVPTGQKSAVGVDGYTVKFNISHFSTYAALTNLTSKGAPIGSGVEIPLPDMFTGAFSHSIPIATPPGRKNMQPSLQLTYRSSNSNSWVGVGFGLTPGYIVRSTRLGPPSYIDAEDSFYCITDAGSTELVHLIDNLYQAKIESSFTKFYKESDDSWRLVSKDGSVLIFGTTPDSKETSSKGTYSWYLTKALDTNGNYIEYQYIKDEGKSYLSRIDYTGNENGLSPTNSVGFFLESREDVSSNYLSGSMITTSQRLSEIQVKVSDDLVWRYELEYIYSQDTNRSLLKSVTQYGADGKAFPSQAFTYQKAQ